MNREKLNLSIQTVKENISILEKDEMERQIQTAKTMIEKMVSCYDQIEKGSME